MEAIITVGISASGKSTWTDEFLTGHFTWTNINRDDIRFDCFCEGKRDWSKYKWKNEKKVTEIVHQKIEEAALRERSIIISDTNLNPWFRIRLIEKLEGYGYEVEIKEFPITLEEAWKRDALRANGVGHSVIYKQWQQWLEYKGVKKYTGNDNQKCVIVDVDGTIADMAGQRGPFEWHKVDQDLPHHEVMDIVDGLENQGYKIVFLSGRDGVCYEDTYNWLKKYFSFDITLFMRAEGDMRKDAIIKEELFWEYIAEHYDVAMAVDDRSRVCRMWRDIGLKVIQVADPYIEF